MSPFTTGLVAVGLSAIAVAAHAQTPPNQAQPAAPAPRIGVTVETPRPSVAPAPLDGDELSELTARQGATSTTSVLSDQDLTAINRGNAINANSVGSGQVSIGANAFSGFAGVGNFVINSGHNNNLQGALTINVVSP